MDVLSLLVRPTSFEGPGLDEALVDRLVTHGLGPLTAARCSDQVAGGRLSVLRYAAAAAHLARAQVLTALGTACRADGVDCIVLKGAALADRCWPDPALRPSCDIDVLVRPDSLSPVGEVFRRLGYGLIAEGPSSQKWQSAASGRPPLDVTTALRAVGSVNPTYRVAAADLFERSEPFAAVPGLLRLADIDAVIHAAVHASDHAFSRFVWLADLAFMMDARSELFEGGELLATAARVHARRALQLALHLTMSLFRAGRDVVCPCPPPWGTAWFVRRVLRRHLDWSDAVIDGRLRLLLRITLVDRPRDLARALLGMAAR